MSKIIFHVGMGKTGSTAIQSALEGSATVLAKAGCCYLGQWLGMVRPEFDQFQGFQAFLRQPPDQMEVCAQRLLAVVEERRRQTGAHTFVISNEQYLENIPNLAEFFKTLLQGVELEVVIFVRPAASWLPSAYSQWGVSHKTNPGPVRSFGVKARELIQQYGFVRQWRELFGPAVMVRAFGDNGDAVQEFSSVLGVQLTPAATRQQVRPPISETLMRAACNNAFPQMVLPDVYNHILSRHIPAGTLSSISQKYSHIFEYELIPQIIEENMDTLSFIEREFGVDLTSQPQPEAPVFDLSGLTDELVGTMLDLVFFQAVQMERLQTRLEALEAKSSQG